MSSALSLHQTGPGKKRNCYACSFPCSCIRAALKKKHCGGEDWCEMW